MNFLPKPASNPPFESLAQRFVDAVSQPVRILLVEDSADDRILISALLKNYNVEIVEAVDKVSAIERAGNESYDLALVDMRLPWEGNGVSVVRQLHQVNPTLPICAYSGDLNGDIVSRAVEAAGVIAFAPKMSLTKKYLIQLFNIFNLGTRAGMNALPEATPT